MRYQERNDECRKSYEVAVAQIPIDQRVYVDETGFNQPLIREFAYSLKGVEVLGERTGKQFARTSLIAGLHNNKPIAPFEFKGYCDTQVVLTWLENVLLPEIPKGSTIIWDNASFHKSPKILALIEDAGCKLLFLPAYSLDLNPIEQFWAWLKSWIRGLNEPYLHISQALSKVFGKFFI